jgi:hypothetical protein
LPSPSRLAAAHKLSLQPCDLRAQLLDLRPPCADFAHTAQTWALILQRLAGYAASNNLQPIFFAPMA